MAGRGNGKQHLTVRVDAETVDLLDTLGEEWNITKGNGEVNRSEVMRLLIDSYGGLLTGRFFSLVESDKLATEWGAAGKVLAAANEAGEVVPDAMLDAQLVDVLKPLPDLVGAGRVATGTPPVVRYNDHGIE